MRWNHETRISFGVRFAAAAILIASCAGAAFADNEKEKILEPGKWYPSLESGLNMTQSSYSDNWSGGDKGSMVWAFITNGELESQMTGKLDWRNRMKLAFGQTHQQVLRGNGSRSWDKPEKSSDLIDFETIFRFTLGWFVDPYVSGRFESQFLDVSDTLANRTIYLNPLKFKESGGVAREFIKEEDRELLSRVGFTLRQSARRFLLDTMVSGDTETETTNGGGFEWVTDYKNKILDDQVSWTSKLTLYQPVFYSDKDVLDGMSNMALREADLPGDIAEYTTGLDIDWENIFTTQITRYLAVDLYLRWMYDKYDNTVPPVLGGDGKLENADDVRAAIRRSGQFKQTLSLGLTYRFL